MAAKIKPAFPGRASSLGYEPGLSKLEWIVTQLMAGGQLNVEQAILIANEIIRLTAKAESQN
jgi:hypothetical protein